MDLTGKNGITDKDITAKTISAFYQAATVWKSVEIRPISVAERRPLLASVVYY
jgi:hypothetical protein